MCRGARAPLSDLQDFKERVLSPLSKKFARRKTNPVKIKKILEEFKNRIKIGILFGVKITIVNKTSYTRGRRIIKSKLVVSKCTPIPLEEHTRTRRGLFEDDDTFEGHAPLNFNSDSSVSTNEDSISTVPEQITSNDNNEDDISTVEDPSVVPDQVTSYDNYEDNEEESTDEELVDAVPDQVTSYYNRENIEEEEYEEERTDEVGTVPEQIYGPCNCENCRNNNEAGTEEDSTGDIDIGAYILDTIERERNAPDNARFIQVSGYYDYQQNKFVTQEYLREQGYDV